MGTVHDKVIGRICISVATMFVTGPWLSVLASDRSGKEISDHGCRGQWLPAAASVVGAHQDAASQGSWNIGCSGRQGPRRRSTTARRPTHRGGCFSYLSSLGYAAPCLWDYWKFIQALLRVTVVLVPARKAACVLYSLLFCDAFVKHAVIAVPLRIVLCWVKPLATSSR